MRPSVRLPIQGDWQSVTTLVEDVLKDLGTVIQLGLTNTHAD
jgi:hypothetical protein